MASSRDSIIKDFGFTAVPASQEALFKTASIKSPAQQLKTQDIRVPDTPLVKAVDNYVAQKLPKQTYHHSWRVFYYGWAIKEQHFPSWAFTAETYLLSCLLHDIGTTDENLNATMMSFEWYGAFLAKDLVMQQGGQKELAESVCEAITRHQDLRTVGNITAVGQLLQLATIFDNMGINPHLIAKETIESVVDAYPRLKWSDCFSATIRKENSLKPWAHTTALGEEDFPEGVKNNKLMAPYD